MAEIQIKYLFVKKDTAAVKSVKEIILEIVDQVAQERNQNIIFLKDGSIKYRINQREDKCYFELTSNARANQAIAILSQIDCEIKNSKQQKFFHYIKVYDGVSEYYCKKLYPKLAAFEREMRNLMHLILVETYGNKWINETIDKELQSSLKEVGRGNLDMNSVLELMNMYQLEEFLFKERSIDSKELFQEHFGKEKLEKMDKEEICNLIEQKRPTSLWERCFSDIGKQEVWKERLQVIHSMRNKIAHQRFFSMQDYQHVNKQLDLIINDLQKAIGKLQEEQFVENISIDVFLDVVGTMSIYYETKHNSEDEQQRQIERWTRYLECFKDWKI